jgi:Shikimate kinase
MVIYLLGFMGCGKTTLGKRLSKKLNCRFIDMDHYIETKMGLSIKDIFSQCGEQRFREIEKETLSGLSDSENLIIATGGGAPCFYDNIEVMNRKGFPVYLKVSPQELFKRLHGKTDKRPLLKDKSDDELMNFIVGKLNEREVFYSRAKIVIEGDAIKEEDVIKRIRSITPQLS